MPEYFYITNSRAAPFFSDTDEGYEEAADPTEAVERIKAKYNHLAGLFALAVYADADAYHKGQKALAMWLSERAEKRTDGVQCPHCGGTTTLSVGNANRNGGINDLHTCKQCGKDVLVDMSDC